MRKEFTTREMLTTIARGQLASGQVRDLDEMLVQLRGLTPTRVVEQFHVSVATLNRLGLLTGHERAELQEYAEEWFSRPQRPSAA